MRKPEKENASSPQAAGRRLVRTALAGIWHLTPWQWTSITIVVFFICWSLHAQEFIARDQPAGELAPIEGPSLTIENL